VTAIVFLGACDRGPAPAEPVGQTVTPSSAPTEEATAAQASADEFTDRVWWRTDQGSASGAMQVFLSNGTLISDSCFETYRLSSWRQDGDEITWSEDGAGISARVASVGAAELVLRVSLTGGEEEQHFSAAAVPYVCPDMPR
jgi:hypothetical protein